MSAMGLGLLTWYYSAAITRQAHAEGAARSAAQARAKGEMPLPPLGRIEPPRAAPHDALRKVLGPEPELPDPAAEAAWRQSDALLQTAHANTAPKPKSPSDLALERRLAGAVFARSSEPTRNVSTADTPASLTPVASAASENDGLAELLRPVSTPAVSAHVLPTREFLLAKGAFIDCTLETAIDSTLPGMVTCITATDTFGSDGRIVLLERGTKLVGESRAQVQQGASRVFVLWSEARTPAGVVVPIASPGTDELGRAGLPGTVDRHFWDRFGAAILISIVNGAVQAAAQSGSGEGTIIVNPSVSSDVMTEVLRSTIAIPPTIRKAQGDRIQVLVARDVDFRSVYALRTASASVTP
ncbi:MAG TPA: type IV secretion system protein VirB10 [Polyangiaceae bacterium]|nr:type IV secretion system protein VirB10 [Polyangiaceae bacterium]